MSSYTQIDIQPSQPVIREGRQLANLQPLLGRQGCRLLEATLEGVATRHRRDGFLPGEDPALLAWKRSVERTGAGIESQLYTLTLEAGRLPEPLRTAGAQQLSVTLVLEGSLAEVRHQLVLADSSRLGAGNTVAVEAERVAHRAVNHLLAHALANRLRQSVEERMLNRLGQRVEMVITERQTHRIYADTSVAGGGTPWASR